MFIRDDAWLVVFYLLSRWSSDCRSTRKNASNERMNHLHNSRLEVRKEKYAGDGFRYGLLYRLLELCCPPVSYPLGY